MKDRKQKTYVVWSGLIPGVYRTWDECKTQVHGIANAKYKSFESLEEAQEAFENLYENYTEKKSKVKKVQKRVGEPILKSISVDAACSGVGGPMEYQGVDTETKALLFHLGPFQDGTNNLGEFLALVHGLAFLKQIGNTEPIYTDSITAIAWVRDKKCNSKHPISDKNKSIFDLVKRAEDWLKNNEYSNSILKWETSSWGEIPADFGRK